MRRGNRLLMISMALLLGWSGAACNGGGDAPPTAVPGAAGTGAPAQPAGVAVVEGATAPTPDPAVPAPNVAPAQEPEEPEVPDFQIATRIRNRLLADEVTRGDVRTIVVSVEDGAVRLTGSAETAMASLRAQAIAEGAFGADSVSNAIEAPAPAGDEAARAAQVPAAIASLEPQFAPGVVNYATGEVISELDVPAPAGVQTAPPAQGSADTGSAAAATPEAPTPPPSEPTPPRNTSGNRRYTVQAGDTLSSIAAREMGAASRWRELFEANERALDGDPNHVRAGVVLTIPE